MKEYENMSEYAKLKLDTKLGATGGIGMYNGKRVLFQKHGKTLLPHDRNGPVLDSMDLSGQDAILVERSI